MRIIRMRAFMFGFVKYCRVKISTRKLTKTHSKSENLEILVKKEPLRTSELELIRISVI